MPCGTTSNYHHIIDIVQLRWYSDNTDVFGILISKQVDNLLNIKYSCDASYNKCVKTISKS